MGKGTQADLLHQRLNACHLSTGDLVPDSIVWEMVLERSGCLRCGGGFLLDGFPRTLAQAESLKQLMENQRLDLTAVPNYRLPLNEIVARLSGRRTCQGCKAVYHVTEHPPRLADTCDRCGEKLFQREDDQPNSVKVRLEAYETEHRAIDRILSGVKNVGDHRRRRLTRGDLRPYNRGAGGSAEKELSTQLR